MLPLVTNFDLAKAIQLKLLFSLLPFAASLLQLPFEFGLFALYSPFSPCFLLVMQAWTNEGIKFLIQIRLKNFLEI